MSVTTSFMGRLGNNLFQYTIARLYAERNGLHFATNWNNEEHFKVTKPATGVILHDDELVISDLKPVPNNIHGNYDEFSESRRRARFFGYFQQSRWFVPHRDQIKTYFDLPMIEPNHSDIVMHFRADDYGSSSSIIHPNWYLDILRREQFDRLYIVMSPVEMKFIDYFKDFNPIVISSTVRDDFLFIRNFKKIICSNSSFCWWAAFLGDYDRIYTFPAWNRDEGGVRGVLFDLPHAIQIEGSFYTDPMV
jgi:hypothetical protein